MPYSPSTFVVESTPPQKLTPGKGGLTPLQALESDAIEIFREVVTTCRRPAMLYSMGKDSSVLLHLALKAFYPADLPFPLVHVDTTWKFRDMYAVRDAAALKAQIIVHQNPTAVGRAINPFDHGASVHTHLWKTEGLKQVIDAHGFDACFGGARRDEEKSRAKERMISLRNAAHVWDPRNQRPEFWRLANMQKRDDESFRVFPLSNWTERDVWAYIAQERIEVAPLYFAAERPVVVRDGALIMVDDGRFRLLPGETPSSRKVRFRTLGCYPLTCAIESDAATVEAIVDEIDRVRTSERQGRLVDRDTHAMEKMKREGYF